MPQTGKDTIYSLPAGQTSGQRSALPSMAGSLGSPRTAERTHRPAEDRYGTQTTNIPHLHLRTKVKTSTVTLNNEC